MKLENTLKGNFPTLEFKVNNEDMQVSMADMQEYPIKDKNNKARRLDVIRREIQQGEIYIF